MNKIKLTVAALSVVLVLNGGTVLAGGDPGAVVPTPQAVEAPVENKFEELDEDTEGQPFAELNKDTENAKEDIGRIEPENVAEDKTSDVEEIVTGNDVKDEIKEAAEETTNAELLSVLALLISIAAIIISLARRR